LYIAVCGAFIRDALITSLFYVQATCTRVFCWWFGE